MKDDCISRQAVIARLNQAAENWNIAEPYHEGMRAGFRNAARIVLEMPSAKPQITECEHCLAYDHFDNGVDGFCRKMGKVMCVSDFCSYAERRQDGTACNNY